MNCARCKKEITGKNAIMSNKGQIDTVNHYGLEKFTDGSNTVERTDIRVHFTFDRNGQRADLCKKCFGVIVREMIEADRI